MDRTEGIENHLRELREQIGPGVEDAKERLRGVNQKVIAFVKERPGTCLVAALGVGLLIGRILRR